MISLHHDANHRLYSAALNRRLRCRALSADTYAVSSHSVPSREYRAQVTDYSYLCVCSAATSGRACSHGALAAAARFPSLIELWRIEAECAAVEKMCGKVLASIPAFIRKRHKQDCKAWRRELRRVRRAKVIVHARTSVRNTAAAPDFGAAAAR